MVPVPEMAAFGERFGFQFVAHDDRRMPTVRHAWSGRSTSSRTTFWPDAPSRSWEDLNQQARQWCDQVNSTYKKHIRAVPRELFAVERLHLKPLPAWIPEVYRLHQRMVDIEGYVALHTNRYSVPVDWIGRRVEVRETKDKIEIQLDARRLVTHRRIAEAEHQRITLAEHRPPRGQGIKRPDPHPGRDRRILTAAPELADYVAALKQRSRKVVTLALRQLLRMVREYPREPLLARRARGRPLRSLRSGPAGTHDPAPCGARVLSARSGEIGTMTEELEQLLKNLKLRRILEIYDEQLRAADKDDISYSEFVTRLVRAQWHARQEGALEWRIRRANLPERWSLETFPFARQPGVNRKQIRGFAELEFVAKAENIVLVGPTGVGKTGLACGSAAEGAGEWLPLPVRPRPGPVR